MRKGAVIIYRSVCEKKKLAHVFLTYQFLVVSSHTLHGAAEKLRKIEGSVENAFCCEQCKTHSVCAFSLRSALFSSF